MIDDNVVNVGGKPPANYAFSALFTFNQGYDEVVLRARGNNISNALRAAAKIIGGTIPGSGISDVKISFDEKDDQKKPGKKVYIPSLEITIKKEMEPREYNLPEIPQDKEDSVIFIGKKDIQTYAVVAAAKLADFDTIHLRARGNNVAKAAKVAAVLTNMIAKDSKLKAVYIGFSERQKGKRKEVVPEIDIEVGF